MKSGLSLDDDLCVFLCVRTSDLVSPCSFGSSLLDRILALLPQLPTKSIARENAAEKNATVRCKLCLSVTEAIE